MKSFPVRRSLAWWRRQQKRQPEVFMGRWMRASDHLWQWFNRQPASIGALRRLEKKQSLLLSLSPSVGWWPGAAFWRGFASVVNPSVLRRHSP